MPHPDGLLLSAVDGTLTPDDQLVLHQHLGDCQRCRERLAGMELLDARLRDLPQLQPPPGFAAALRAQLEVQPAPRRVPPWPLPLALGLLGAFGVGLTYAELSALAGALAGAAYDLSLWLLALVAGSGRSAANLSWPSAGLDPLLLFGLCLIGMAGALVLQRTLPDPLADA